MQLTTVSTNCPACRRYTSFEVVRVDSNRSLDFFRCPLCHAAICRGAGKARWARFQSKMPDNTFQTLGDLVEWQVSPVHKGLEPNERNLARYLSDAVETMSLLRKAITVVKGKKT